MRARTPSRTLAAAALRRTTIIQTSRPQSTSSSSTPSSSPAASSSWQPVLSRGSMPVYDAALDFLASHRDKCNAELERLNAITDPTPEQRAEAEKWEVDGYVNDPATRALFKQTKGYGHMHRPVMRHLAERHWKQDGGLDLIMGRIFQNKVVPDVLPDLAPPSPLTISVNDQTITPATNVLPSSFEEPPKITFQSFQHPSLPTSSQPNPSTLYTLVVVDPDTPDVANHSYSQRLHYLKTDIPLSVVTDQESLIHSSIGNELVSWEPIAPAQNSGKRRLIFILLRQLSGEQSKLTTPPPREDFNVRSLMATLDFPLNSIVGVNLVKTEWTEEEDAYIKRIWKTVHLKKAPVFKRVAKVEKYAKPLSPIQKRAEALRERAWQRSFEELEREFNTASEEFSVGEAPKGGK